jgi:hypothetical protein
MNWFVVSKNEDVSDCTSTSSSESSRSHTPDIPDTPDTPNISDIINMPYTPVISDIEISKNLLIEIIEFDKEDLNQVYPIKYYFYDLLDEIKNRIDLKHVETKESCSFLTKLKYNLEVIIVNDRLKRYGEDNRYLYTDNEYEYAFKKLLQIESGYKFRKFTNLGFVIFLFTGFGLLNDNSPFLSGIYFTNIILIGSFLFCNST